MKNIDLVGSIPKHLYYRTRVVAGCLDNVDSFLDNNPRVSDIIRRRDGRKQSNIDSKRL